MRLGYPTELGRDVATIASCGAERLSHGLGGTRVQYPVAQRLTTAANHSG